MPHTIEPLGTAELARVATILTAIDRDTAQPRVVTVDELREEFDGVHTHPEHDVFGIRIDDAVVACGYTYLLAGSGAHRCYVMGGVLPSHRRLGIGSALLDELIVAAEHRLVAIGDDVPLVIRAYLPVADPTLDAMFERRGFAAVRWFDDLHRPSRQPPLVDEPHDVTVTLWDPARSEELRTVKNAAFADHWGSEPSSPHEWHQLTNGTAARLDLSTMAIDNVTGAIVGLVLVHRHDADDALGPSYAWIDKVATIASHRGRGIAAALIASSISAIEAEGIERVALGVDSDSPTGAHHLYRRLGFEPWTRYVTRERWLRNAPE